MSEELKPCPFCGANAKVTDYDEDSVSCARCSDGECAGSYTWIAVGTWNRRAADAELAALRARVAELEREVELLRDTASTEARLACAWARKLPDDHWMIRDGIVIGLRSLISLGPRAEGEVEAELMRRGVEIIPSGRMLRECPRCGYSSAAQARDVKP